jgi:hypothetical protein
MHCRAVWLLLVLVTLGVGCTATPIPLPPPTGSPDGGWQRLEGGAPTLDSGKRDTKAALDAKPGLDKPPTPFFDLAGMADGALPGPLDARHEGAPGGDAKPGDAKPGDAKPGDGGAMDATAKGEK